MGGFWSRGRGVFGLELGNWGIRVGVGCLWVMKGWRVVRGG